MRLQSGKLVRCSSSPATTSSSSPRCSASSSPMRAEAVRSRRSSGLRLDRARSSDRVELVRVVEDGCLGGARSAGIVMGADRVEDFGEDGPVELPGALLDEAEAQVDVAEQLSLRGREEERAAVELAHTADVVEKRCRDEEVTA